MESNGAVFLQDEIFAGVAGHAEVGEKLFDDVVGGDCFGDASGGV